MENLVAVLIILTSILIVLQMGILVGVFVSIRKLTHHVERLRNNFEQKAEPILADMGEILAHAKDIIGNARGAAENFLSISETVKYQVERVNATIEDTTDRARAQISRVDEMVAGAMQRMEATTAVVQQKILAPVREVSALIHGVSSGLRYLFVPRRNPVDEVHQDEELFI